MSVTLEQSTILSRIYSAHLPLPLEYEHLPRPQPIQGIHQARKEYYKMGHSKQNTMQIAQMLREHGVRLPVCKRNIGKAKFAFNKLQRGCLPDVYKPPSNIVADIEVLPT